MLISRIEIDGKSRWIEKDGESYFLLMGDPFNDNLSRENEIEFDESQSASSDLYKPVSVFGLAYNYKSLVEKEQGFDDPLVFLKSVNSISGGIEEFEYSALFTKIWVECELVIVIKKKCKSISAAEVPDCILGYTIGSDITAANKYGRDHHLALSKAADGFAPLYKWINTDLNTSDLKMSTKINGNTFQEDSTGNRIWDEFHAISSLSKSFTLHPGDIIFTGTPAGAMESVIVKGDRVEHHIENIGTMSFTVK